MSNRTHPTTPTAPFAPIFVTDVAREIKKAGSSIWLLQKAEYGFVLRCEWGTRQFRVILSPLAGEAAEVPQEGEHPVHVVSTLAALRAWLKLLPIS